MISARLRGDLGLAFLLAALVVTVALYAATLGRGLVNYDDPWLVRDNLLLHDLSWSAIEKVFFDFQSPLSRTGAEYLPVRDLSIMLDFAIWGDRYAGFHVTNLVIYLLSIGVWFAGLTKLGIDRKVAGVAVLLWAIHPSHAESVAWISERKGLLSMLFAGACVLGYAHYRGGRRAGWLVLAALAAVLAVWSKATGAFAVAALVPLEWVLPATVSRRRRVIGLVAIGAAAVAAFIPVVMMATQAAVVGASGHAASRLETVLGVHGFYLRATGMTMKNAVSYAFTIDGPSVADLALGAFGLVAVLALAIVPRRGRWAPPVEARAGAWLWLLGWLPASHAILPLQQMSVADRYLLLPTLGATLIVAAGVVRISRVSTRRALIGALVIAAGLRTLDAQSSWRDAATLWERAIASNPADPNAWALYVEAAVEQRGLTLAQAEALVAEAQRAAPSAQLIHRHALLVLPIDRARGLALMRRAAEEGEPLAMSNLALLLLEDRAFDDALAWARRGAAARPGERHVWRTLGKVALAAGHADEALPAFAQALVIEPSCTNHFNIALALVALQRGAEAIPHLDPCVEDARVGPRARALRASIH